MADPTEESSRNIVQTKEFALQINEAGSGYPIIMLHGSGPGATGWTNFGPNIVALSKKYRVIAMTFPGWGLSSETDPGKEPQRVTNARAVKLLMDELGLDKAAVVGNSMGGACVQQFLVDYPERMSHFITMGAAGPGVSQLVPGGMTEGIRILTQAYRDPSPENFRKLVSIMVYDASFVTDELCELRAKAALANRKHLENFLNPKRDASGGGDAMVAALQNTKTPALIVHGRDDRTVPMEGSLRLNALIPNSRMLVFNRCGHWAQLEHAGEFNQLLDTFVSR